MRVPDSESWRALEGLASLSQCVRAQEKKSWSHISVRLKAIKTRQVFALDYP